MTLKGKTAVITGSNSGIGLGVAREMARAGADVVLNSFTDRDEDHALADGPAARPFCTTRLPARRISRTPDRCGKQHRDCTALVHGLAVRPW